MTPTDIINLNIQMSIVSFIVGVGVGLLIVQYSKEYKKMHPKCQHKNKHTYIDWVAGTCEKTTVTCLDCNKKFKSKLEC